MFEHRARGRCAVLVLGLIVGFAIASSAEAQSWRTITSARQIWGTDPVEVDVEYGAGELDIDRVDSPSILYRMEMRYDEEQSTPVAEFDSAARRLKLGSRNTESRGRRMHEGSTASISLSDRVPLDLSLHFGAGKATLDLSGLRLERLDVETGASQTTIRFDDPNPIQAEEVQLKAGAAELNVLGLGNARAKRFTFQGGVGSTTLDFGGSWRDDATANVQMGMGSVVLRFPRGLGVKLTRSSFLTSFEADDLVRNGESYFSEDWERAEHQLTVDIEAAFGSIEIEWIDD